LVTNIFNQKTPYEKMYLRKVLLLQKCLKYYAANGKKEERTVRFMDRIGVDALKQAVL